jgi:hypothetical protein
VRSLNLLLKSVRLYRVDHPRSREQLDTAWSELRSSLDAEGALTVSVASGRLLLNGVPLDPSAAEQSFAHLLNQAHLTSLQFSPHISYQEFCRFLEIFAEASRGSEQLAQIGARLEAEKLGNVRVNTVRYVAQDPALGDAAAVSDVAGELVRRTLGSNLVRLQDWLTHPQKLIQLVAAAQGAQAQPAPSSAAPPQTPLTENDVFGGLGWLRQLAQLGAAAANGQTNAVEVESHLQAVPATLLAQLEQAVRAAPATGDTDLLMQLAEHMAIRYALAQFESGQTRVNQVRQLIDRFAKEISTLRTILNAHEDKMRKAGLAPDSYADTLDKQFWASLPPAAKAQVLLSPEAWCIPARNVRSYLEELFATQQEQQAFAVLLNYATCVNQPETDARRKAALGLGELTDLLARGGEQLLRAVSEHLTRQLKTETDPDVRGLLVNALSRVTHQAAKRSHYLVVVHSLEAAEILERLRPTFGRSIRTGLLPPAQVRELFLTALQAPSLPGELVRMFAHLPELSVELLLEHFRTAERIADRERLAELAAALGGPVRQGLTRHLEDAPPTHAVEAVGLLSRLSPEWLEQHLAFRIADWDRITQDRAVRAIAAAGGASRGKLLEALAPWMDPLVIPGLLDEIGIAGEGPTVPWLLRIASGDPPLGVEPYFRIKAIEALGRINDRSAVPALTQLVEQKHVWRYAQPTEIRLCAAQALLRLDPEHAQDVLRRVGLAEKELSLAPLYPGRGAAWIRQRRYQRLALPSPVPTVLSWPQGSFRCAAKTLSLGGGYATGAERVIAGTAVDVALEPTLRSIRGRALVRRADTQGVGFEFVDMDPENRRRLRQLLSRFTPAV